MYALIRPLLYKLSPETSHDLLMMALRLKQNLSCGTSKPITQFQSTQVMGIDFPNRVGLAAGLDKNARCMQALGDFGFGFIEVGTVTPRAQQGNPMPRLFRLTEDQAIINRMGFNNDGVEALLNQIALSHYQGILGINIGKNRDTPLEQSHDDYLQAFESVYTHADYITINVSSPNTPGLRDLQHVDELAKLLKVIKNAQQRLSDRHSQYVPVAVKVAPDLSQEDIRMMADCLVQEQIDGLIATNTLLDKSAVQHSPLGKEAGGLSGAPLTQRSTEVIAQFSEALAGEIPIIGVGGIMNGQDAVDKLQAGAQLVQLYTGLIYQGPCLVTQCIKAIEQHLVDAL